VHSKPNLGSRFVICFPQIDGSPAASSSLVPEADYLLGTETILLVEDQEVLKGLIARMLRKYGYAVLDAAQGGEALLLAEQHDGPIDLLLTDVVMPRMNGPELASRLTATYPKMAVLYMSGYSDDTIVHDVVLANPMHYIQKPFSSQKLANKVREVLAARDEHHLSTT